MNGAGVRFSRVTVIGVGLIGGSFALALKASRMADEIVGLSRSPDTSERARDLGIIDTVAHEIEEAVDGADLVMVAVPVAQTGDLLARMSPYLAAHAVVTDAGSTKQGVVDAARAFFADRLDRFVPGHPIAGAEVSGPDAARSDLYKGRNVVLTPIPETDYDAIGTVRAAWATCGAHVHIMAPGQHDRVLSAVSHLPHALAFAYMNMVVAAEDCEQLLQFAGSGFRDFTRIAGSHPEMWVDICLDNREALLAQLGEYQRELGRLREAIERRDRQYLMQFLAEASQVRRDWGRKP